MNFVVIESPYAGDVLTNVTYAKRALRDSIARGEAPFASHLLYTQVLNDLELDQRSKGISLNLTLIERCDYVAVYMDLGISPGMRAAIDHAAKFGKTVSYRMLD